MELRKLGIKVTFNFVKAHDVNIIHESRQARNASFMNAEYQHEVPGFKIYRKAKLKEKLSQFEQVNFNLNHGENYLNFIEMHNLHRNEVKNLPKAKSLTMIITGHGPFRSYLHKINKIASPLCPECEYRGLQCEQTLIHLLHDC